MAAKERSLEELEHIEIVDAWFEYFAATHGQPYPKYFDIEPHAWARLERRIAATRKHFAERRAKSKAPAA